MLEMTAALAPLRRHLNAQDSFLNGLAFSVLATFTRRLSAMLIFCTLALFGPFNSCSDSYDAMEITEKIDI